MISRLGCCLIAFATLAGPAYAQSEVQPLDLVKPVADYKIYVSGQLDQLVAETRTFVAAIKAGDLKQAKALYAPARIHYESIEPVAELFSDLDGAIDSRVDDHPKGPTDPEFTGFHRLEYGLFEQNSLKGLAPIADQLMADVNQLKKQVSELTFPPDKVFGGAAGLMEEVASTKISGEEDRYSHTDLWDFKGNVDGSKKIFDLVRPLIESGDKDFVHKVADNFATVETTLAKYKTGNGYQSYDKLSDADRKTLSAAVNTLAEDLSTLKGKLGVG